MIASGHTSYTTLLFTLSALLLAPALTTHAAITPTGDVTPTYNGTDPWDAANFLRVGDVLTGTLNISNGSTVNSYLGVIGRESNSNGTVTVIGIGSSWNNTYFYVGKGGTGTLNIENTGAVNSGYSSIGQGVNATGTVTVTGPGSVWNTTNYLTVGSHGTGTLNIDNGGEVHVTERTWIGLKSYSNGTLNLDSGTLNTGGLFASPGKLLGTGTIYTKGLVSDIDLVFDATVGLQQSMVLNDLPGQNIALHLDVSDPENPHSLGVGYRGTASLTIADGLSVASTGGELGFDTGSTGSATITGIGSLWNNSEVLNVGYSGTGTLTIESGGRVNNSDGYVGRSLGTIGTATVSGAGSVWNNSQDLLVGYGGNGTLKIENAGRVTNFNSYIASGSGSTSLVTVTGPGSVWNNEGELNVGVDGVGTLLIENAGRVDNYAGIIDNDSGSISTATVTGPGSVWNNTSYLNVGVSGNGALNIENAGRVSNPVGIIGYNSGSISTAIVTGAASVWDITYRLYVGLSGNGTLNIENAGNVVVQGNILLGWYATGDGTVNLSGGTLDLNGRDLTVGAGTGAFNFTGGTLLNTQTIDLGQAFAQNGGTLAPGGSIGQTDIVGDYALTAGTVEIELGGVGNSHDLITATGDIDIALLGTTLDLSALGAMAAGTYTIIESTSGTITGMFEHVTGIGIYPGLVDVLYTSNAVTITLNWDFVPGDLNGDGFVGISDLNIILPAWNQSVVPGDLSAGDVTGDGFVGIEDLNTVLANWNADTPPPAESLEVVPEPAGVAMLLVGLVGFSCRRLRTGS